jgi:hypothetical protein
VTALPLRLSRERIVMYALLLAALCLVQVRFVVAQKFGDWSAFWAAGSTVGTSALLNPQQHAAWMAAHHLQRTIFPYLPGAAWLLLPIKPLSLAAGYAVNFAVMALASIAAALVAARTYGIERVIAVLLVFAWAPLVAALATAQNSPIGLLFCLLAIAALAVDAELAAGLAAGALLYKWPYALAFIVLFALRRQYRALAVVAAWALVWYVLSVAATAGDLNWPAHYANAVHGYFAADARFNAGKAVGLPMLLMRAGIPAWIAIAAGALLFALALRPLARVSMLEAASMVPAVALVASPHTLPYDCALALPAMFYFMTHAAEPLRTRLVCAIYIIAPFWLLSGVLHFDVLAIVVDGLVIAWIVKGYNESTSRADLHVVDSRDRRQAETVLDQSRSG